MSPNPEHAPADDPTPEALPAYGSAHEDRPRAPKKERTAKRNEKPYDEQTPEEQERTRQLWEEDIRRTREALNYAERFAAEGRRFTEAMPDGSIVQHIPYNERAHERPTDGGELRNRYEDYQRGADSKKSRGPNS